MTVNDLIEQLKTYPPNTLLEEVLTTNNTEKRSIYYRVREFNIIYMSDGAKPLTALDTYTAADCTD